MPTKQSTDPGGTRSGHLRGLGRLAVEATLGVTELVEALHRTISVGPGPLGAPPAGPTTGITGFVYGSVRGVTRLVGSGVDASLARLAPLLGAAPASRERDALLAALNGVLGDHLEATGNPLAIPMSLRRNGLELPPEPAALAAALPGSASRVALLIHGLCMDDACWSRGGDDLGVFLERAPGRTAVALRYNTGRHVSTSGRELARLLETFLSAWPVPVADLQVVAHSMGGLVARSAVHYAVEAGLAWPRLLSKIVFLGTPHHGSPLERGGSLIDAALGVSPYSVPFARLGKIRSAGVTDLRHGNVLDEDWEGHDRFSRRGDPRRPLPLPEGVACYAVAATNSREAGGVADRFVGDGLVPTDSALGRHRDPARSLRFPASRTWIAEGMNHFDLLSRLEVRSRLLAWLDEEAAADRQPPPR